MHIYGLLIRQKLLFFQLISDNSVSLYVTSSLFTSSFEPFPLVAFKVTEMEHAETIDMNARLKSEAPYFLNQQLE